MERLTFVGIKACGHTGYVAQDPATYAESPAPASAKRTRRDYEAEIDDLEAALDEYKSLVDDLRYYARTGQIKLVTDEQLGGYIDQMQACDCHASASL